MAKTPTPETATKLLTSLPDGTHIVEHPDGRLERQKSRTDWQRLRTITDDEIEASIADDPDWREFADLNWSETVLVAPSRKKAISIRVDEDVLDYFRSQGAGYQGRMNAVLRSFVEHKRKAAPRKKRA